jgi:hypothetical protein
MEPNRLLVKGSLASIYGYLLYLSITCPCKKVLCCHMNHFFVAMGLATIIVGLETRFKKCDKFVPQ